MTTNPPSSDDLRLRRGDDFVLLRRADLRELLDAAVARGGKRWDGLKGSSEYSSLSTKTLRRLISSGRLTPRRPVRGKVLLDRRELDALIDGATAPVRTGRGLANRSPKKA